jgi:hypothetical protein
MMLLGIFNNFGLEQGVLNVHIYVGGGYFFLWNMVLIGLLLFFKQ